MSSKIYQKKEINGALFIMECPECGRWCASASERTYLPEFTTCEKCYDKNQIVKNLLKFENDGLS